MGKTTTAINLACALSEKGKKITVIDIDPQSHLSLGMGVSTQSKTGADDVLFDQSPIDDHLTHLSDKLSVLSAGERLGEVEGKLKGGSARGWLLKNAIESSVACQQSDFCIIDCPPSSGLLGMNALLAANELMIPVSSDFLALHGVSRMINIIDYIDESLNKQSKRWFVITRYHTRRKLSQEVREKLVEYFKSAVLATPVRESVALAECPSFGQSIFEYQPNGNGAKDYRSLADDLLVERVMQ